MPALKINTKISLVPEDLKRNFDNIVMSKNEKKSLDYQELFII
jgi:hypothetical protein